MPPFIEPYGELCLTIGMEGEEPRVVEWSVQECPIPSHSVIIVRVSLWNIVDCELLRCGERSPFCWSNHSFNDAFGVRDFLWIAFVHGMVEFD